MEQFQLFDTPGSTVATIETDGATIKPFLTAINNVGDEARIHIKQDRLTTRLVDPANCLMADVTLGTEAFDEYTLHDETTIGANIDACRKLVRRARKHHDDRLTLNIQEREATATVARGYDNHDVVSQGTTKFLDPDSIRAEPDLTDLDQPINVTVDYEPFMDAFSYAQGAADHVRMRVAGVNQHTDAFYVGGETDVREEHAAIDGVSTDGRGEALYSTTYLVAILSGLKAVDPDRVTIRFAEEYPASFAATGVDGALHVEYTVSPRVESA